MLSGATIFWTYVPMTLLLVLSFITFITERKE